MLQILFNGLLNGAVIALPAIAFTMLFGILKFPNFSIGAFITVGAYAAMVANTYFGWQLWLSAIFAMLITALLIWLSDQLVFKPLRSATSITLLVVSIAVAFIVESIIRLIFGGDIQGLDLELTRPIRFGGFRFTIDQLWIIGIVMLVMLLVSIILKYTQLGKAMRATSDNFDLAEVRGINTSHVIAATWLMGGLLLGLSGLLIGIDLVIEPQIGWFLTIPVFAAAILGGIGSPYGAMIGSVLVGLAEELTGAFLAPSYKVAVGFVIIAILLMFRPQGLFGLPEIKK
ncbi:MAG: branched-chain amino acid ABC transporter permease [Deltaproteobacteria bacterium]|jgi:branched-subunit amino acid ABC-type transport system permease component|nr:branched-chain amino acid ABC transporter permease [Deltaproteobacteria bacterium]